MEQNRIPEHIAIIMDGNGRWAQARGLPRTMGHKAGAEAVKRVVEAAGEAGIKYLTLFGFSSENWKRPPEEVKELMRLLRMYLRSEMLEMHRHGIRLRVIGDRSAFDKDIVALIEQAEELTKDNTKLDVIMALNYGGRYDILQAASRWAQDSITQGRSLDYEDAEEFLPGFLSTADIPEPDILVRSSGEQRISNFLLWQCAYAEMFFVDDYWPDFGSSQIETIIEQYQGRERRFGGLKADGSRA